MINLSCPNCGKMLDIEDPWEFESNCPECTTLLVCSYEESCDFESGEESGWHYLERKK